MVYHYSLLLIARFLLGFAVGIFSVIVPIFIIEISPLKLRGSFGAVSQIAITFGILIAYSLGFNGKSFDTKEESQEYCDDYKKHHDLRINLAFPIIPASIQAIFLFFFYKYESPKYYIIMEEMRDARYCFKKIHQIESTEEVDENIGSSYGNKEEIELLELIDPNKDGRTLRSLRKSKYKRPLLVGLMLIIAQQLSGINIVIFFSNKIFQKTSDSSYIFTLCVGLLNFLATLASMLLLRYLGKKILLLAGML